MLNDRQKDILIKENLPTEYEELTLNQKIAIEAMEDMFVYLDNHYPDEEFEYAGYIAPSSIETEQLLVDSQYGRVTVFRETEGEEKVYSDDYREVKASDVYASVIDDFLSDTIDAHDYIVSVSVAQCDGEVDKENVINSCLAGTTVFVKETVGEEEFKKLASSVSDYLKENAKDVSVTADYYLVKESEFGIDLPQRYADNIDMNIFLKQLSYYHRKNGDEELYEIQR